MRTLPFQLLLLTALLTWRLQKRAAGRGWRGCVLAVGAAIALGAAPHAIWGWDVQRHVPLGYLRLELSLSAAWFFSAGLLGVGLWIWDAAARRLPAPVDLTRRRLLTRAPLTLAAVGPVGAWGGQVEPELRVVRVACPGLPPGLEGLRILQVSDLHLGPCLGLDWLERALARAEGARPDLVAVTGDLSDDVALTLPALQRIAAVPAPLGHFAIPGNHEHYVGIERFEADVVRAGLTLLTDRARVLERGGSAFTLAGINFAIKVHGPREVAAYASLTRAVFAAASSDFRLLLAHHPMAFDAAVENGVGLTLSGHTHGGQIAIAGITPLSLLLRYTRGIYRRGDARLFVTTGLGHWMPFRIGCPTELPLLELHRA